MYGLGIVTGHSLQMSPFDLIAWIFSAPAGRSGEVRRRLSAIRSLKANHDVTRPIFYGFHGEVAGADQVGH